MATGDPQIPEPGTAAGRAFLASLGAGNGMPAAGLPSGMLAPDVPKVFFGRTKKTYPGASDLTPRGFGSTPVDPKQGHIITRTLEQAMSKFDGMSFVEQRNMLRLLAMGGFAGAFALDEVDDFVRDASQGDARAAYQLLLETSSDYYMNSGRQVTPEDVLRSAIAFRLDAYGVDWNGSMKAFNGGIPKDVLKAAAKATGGGTLDSGYNPKDFPYKKTTTAENVDVLNPKDAKYLTRTTLQQVLGRDPTQGEYEDFLSALNAAERANPDVSRTTTTYRLDPTTELPYEAQQRTVTTQGIGEAGLSQVATEKAQRNPDWAEWQAMGTYFPALLAALGSTTGV